MRRFCLCTAWGCPRKGIQENLQEIYNVDVSPELISRVTDEVKGLVEKWRNRLLEPFYPVVFFDALRVNIRDEGHVSKKSVYTAVHRAYGAQFHEVCFVQRH